MPKTFLVIRKLKSLQTLDLVTGPLAHRQIWLGLPHGHRVLVTKPATHNACTNDGPIGPVPIKRPLAHPNVEMLTMPRCE